MQSRYSGARACAAAAKARQPLAATACVASSRTLLTGPAAPAPLYMRQRALRQLQVRAEAAEGGGSAAAGTAVTDRAPIPTRLNTIPHERTTRQHFYRETTEAIKKAIYAGETRMLAR